MIAVIYIYIQHNVRLIIIMKQANLDLSVIERLMESEEPLTEDQREWCCVAIARTKEKLKQAATQE